MVWIYLCIGIILLLILCLFLRIYANFEYKLEQDKELLSVNVRIIGINIINKEMPLLGLDKDDTSLDDMIENMDITSEEPAKSFLQKWKQWKHTFNKLLRIKAVVFKNMSKVCVHQLNWESKVGTGDASSTGIYCGGVWSVKGIVISFISTHMQLKCTPRIMVHPLFQQKLVRTKLSCMVSIKVGQAIYAIIQLMKHVEVNKQQQSTAHT
ncbi:DUF2953 domain-containing protein [Radiobacillus sp. PE A8.2]|uniref:DUF2953 domain-containing protein n=1 Tax=Radiobacillus sp. PE A8.2 TaxID=3380349 RepID=UPI003890C8CA